MKKLILCFTLLVGTRIHAQPPELKKYYDNAVTAYKEKRYVDFYLKICETGKLHPYHQGILYLRGKAAALTGRKEEAIKCLRSAIQIYSPYPLQGVADFDGIRTSIEFSDLLKEQIELKRPIVHSDTALLISNRSLHTEGIAYEPESRTFYFGTINKRKVIAINERKEIKDFCPAGFEGMTSVFGITVDPKRKQLWVCSSPMPEMEDYDTLSPSAVFQFDLKSGKLLQKYEWHDKHNDGLFGDLILSPHGDVYVSDSKHNRIFRVDEKTKQLEIFYSSTEFWNLQGIAFSPNEDYLFIADYIKGIFRLNLKTKALILLSPPDGYSLKGIDGLYFYDNSLLAIQNGVTPSRLTAYFLNPAMEAIRQAKILDRSHPSFGEPTLGIQVGSSFYYIANSQWNGYDESHHLKPNDQLKDVVILKYDLASRP